MGDILILALNTDSSVQRLKGPSRPLIPQDDRVELACALEAVNAVTLFDEDTPRELIADRLPFAGKFDERLDVLDLPVYLTV